VAVVTRRPVDYKRILQLRAEGVSMRGIADVVGCARNTVAAVGAAADLEGIVWADVAGLDSGAVRRLVLPERPLKDPGRVEPDFEAIHKDLARTGVTLLVWWTEYAARCRDEGSVAYR
jgi:transposase